MLERVTCENEKFALYEAPSGRGRREEVQRHDTRARAGGLISHCWIESLHIGGLEGRAYHVDHAAALVARVSCRLDPATGRPLRNLPSD